MCSYINPANRLHTQAPSGISNLAAKVVAVLENLTDNVFGMKATNKEIIDNIRCQWLYF